MLVKAVCRVYVLVTSALHAPFLLLLWNKIRHLA